MIFRKCETGIRYRVWIVRYEEFQPAGWNDIPPGAIAVEPAEGRTMTFGKARRYVEAFNRAAFGGPQKFWAVALPVTIRYEGDPQPGEPVHGLATPTHKKSPLLACQVSASNGLTPRDST